MFLVPQSRRSFLERKKFKKSVGNGSTPSYCLCLRLVNSRAMRTPTIKNIVPRPNRNEGIGARPGQPHGIHLIQNVKNRTWDAQNLKSGAASPIRTFYFRRNDSLQSHPNSTTMMMTPSIPAFGHHDGKTPKRKPLFLWRHKNWLTPHLTHSLIIDSRVKDPRKKENRRSRNTSMATLPRSNNTNPTPRCHHDAVLATCNAPILKATLQVETFREFY